MEVFCANSRIGNITLKVKSEINTYAYFAISYTYRGDLLRKEEYVSADETRTLPLLYL